ncbi:MAG: hypothetical protein K2X81_16360 [Candidatus Obscuribacterales bacterium]|nr:hypothetical protein [Candidatus Obscuribacterales bacterium]
MEGVTAWYVILGVAVLLIALLMRYSTYTFLVRQSRWLPEKAGGAANFAGATVMVLGIGVLLGKALLFGHQ